MDRINGSEGELQVYYTPQQNEGIPMPGSHWQWNTTNHQPFINDSLFSSMLREQTEPGMVAQPYNSAHDR